MEEQIPRVVIGMDPHKRSVTIEVMAADESVLGGGRFADHGRGLPGHAGLSRALAAAGLGDRGLRGHRRHIAHRLLADGQDIVDVPAKLSARARVFATGQGRKTDATDAHSVALVGTRMAGLRPVVCDAQLEVLQLLADRRRSIGRRAHPQDQPAASDLCWSCCPAGRRSTCPRPRPRRCWPASDHETTLARPASGVAAELVVDLERIYPRKKAADKELQELVAATGTSLLALHGIGPSGAARLLVEVGDITRFPDRNHFASWTGTAPIDASSGDHVRHRLSRGGNRQINRALHIMAIVQLRNPTEGRAYYDRKKAAGKTSMEAMRCLKRRLSDLVYRTMLDDLTASKATGPGGHRGNDSDSSAAGSQPHTGSSDKPLPGPATSQPTTALPAAS